MKDRQGFTLLEIMVVVVIIAMLATLSLPKMKGSFQTARLKSGARELSGFFRFARNTAVLRERGCEIRFDLEKDRYWLVLLDENGVEEDLNKRQEQKEKKQFSISEEFSGIRVLPKDVHFNVIYSGAPPTEDKKLPRVVYYQDGSATPATIVIQGAKKLSFNIEIYQTTGIARVEPGTPLNVRDKEKLYYGPKAEQSS